MAKMSKKKQNLISIIILVAGTAISYLIFGPHKSHSQVDPAVVNEKPTANVQTLVLGSDQAKTAKFEKTATFRSARSSMIVAEYSGVLKVVDFEVGEFVNEGQVIASFDQSASENSAKISLDSAQEGLILALNSLDNTKKLVDENVEIARNSRKIAEIQLDQAEDDNDDDAIELAERNLKNAKDLEDQAEESADLQINGAEQQVNQARSAVQQAQISFENTIIKAPISGLIASKEVQLEEYVNLGDNIGEIVGVGKLETVISLNSDQIERVQIGDEVQIIIDGDSVLGEIVSLSPVASGESQRFDVKVQTIDDYSGRANMSGKVIIELALSESIGNRYFVPLESINIGQKKTVIFVVVEDRAVTRGIEIGEVIGTKVEIVEGLEAGEEVIIGNSRNLQEGQRINRNN